MLPIIFMKLETTSGDRLVQFAMVSIVAPSASAIKVDGEWLTLTHSSLAALMTKLNSGYVDPAGEGV